MPCHASSAFTSDSCSSLALQVEAADGPATEFFLNAVDALGEGAYVTATGLGMKITVGDRQPFLPSAPEILLVIPPSAPLRLMRSESKITGTLKLLLPAEVATPKPAVLQQEGVLGYPCGDAEGRAVVMISPEDGEVWADVAWEIDTVPTGVEAEFLEHLVLINSRPNIKGRNTLRESQFTTKWPSGSYSLVVTVRNYAGGSTRTPVVFERSSFALPAITVMGHPEFRRTRGIELAPVGGSQGCGTGLRYLWTSVDGALQLPNPEAPFLRIAPNAPWAVPGQSYPMKFTVQVWPSARVVAVVVVVHGIVCIVSLGGQ